MERVGQAVGQGWTLARLSRANGVLMVDSVVGQGVQLSVPGKHCAPCWRQVGRTGVRLEARGVANPRPAATRPPQPVRSTRWERNDAPALPRVEGLRREGDPITLDPATVICAECGKTIGEDEAQATRWGYWAESVGDLYPFCFGCAALEFGHARGSANGA